jgi:DNA replication protein DnaC
MTATADIQKTVKRMLSKATLMTPDQERDWLYKNVILEHLESTRLPEAHFLRVKKWNPSQKRAYTQIKSLLSRPSRTGRIIALVGPRGLGKTTIAGQLIQDRAWDDSLLPWHRRPPYRKASELVKKFKSSYSDFGSIDNEYLIHRFNDYVRHPFLIIDEWHESEDLRVHNRLMTDLLDQRYAWGNHTLIISNQTTEQFTETTNESTLSRMQESGGLIKCEWPSFR